MMCQLFTSGSIFSPIKLKTAGKISQLSLKMAQGRGEGDVCVIMNSSHNWSAVRVSENETKIVHKTLQQNFPFR